MMERTIAVRTEPESISVEQAPAMAREPEAVTDAAPGGRALALGELAAVRPGRELPRVAPESARQRQRSWPNPDDSDRVQQRGLRRRLERFPLECRVTTGTEQPAISSWATDRNASPIASISRPTDRAAALRRYVFSLLNIFSIGLKSGLEAGR